MEDHHGNLILDDRVGGGASIRLIFASDSAAARNPGIAARAKLGKSYGA
jgi:hypothetical protein